MPGTTPKGGLPYPLPSDPLKDHGSTVQQLAESIQSGTQTVAMAGANVTVSVPITFDPPFTAPPSVVCDVQVGSPFAAGAAPDLVTAAGFNLQVIQNNTVATRVVSWQAIGTV